MWASGALLTQLAASGLVFETLLGREFFQIRNENQDAEPFAILRSENGH